MKLNELISHALHELDIAKGDPRKANYLVDEVTLEIHVTSVEARNRGLEVKIFNVGGGGKNSNKEENAHKIIIKLKPNPKKAIPAEVKSSAKGANKK